MQTSERTRRMNTLGAGPYPFRNAAAIAAGAVWFENLENVTTNTELKKYLPMNYISITNTSDKVIEVYVNGVAETVITGSQSEKISREGIRDFKIKNLDVAADVAINQLIIKIGIEVTEDSMAVRKERARPTILDLFNWAIRPGGVLV